MTGIETVDHSHGVPVDAISLQQPYALHDTLKRRFACGVDAIFVVKPLRTVDRDPDEPAVVAQKPTPFLVEQCGVGLQTVLDCQSAAIFLLQPDDLLIERQRSHRRFATVPHKRYEVGCLCLYVLGNEAFECLV